MPQRQFIGDHPEVRRAIEGIVRDNVSDFFNALAHELHTK